MKCPYCGAEASGRKCEYCNSDLSELFKDIRPSRDDDDELDEITDAMIDEIRKLCDKFQRRHQDEFSTYDDNGELLEGSGVKDRLFDVLDIPDDEEVFLIHDDTILHSGKNGFAITECGFYCKENAGELEVTDFEDIDEDDEVDYDNCIVYLVDDDTPLAYFTGSEKVREDIADLIDDIIDVLYDEDLA